MTKPCRSCTVELNIDNWFESFAKANNRICKDCHRKATADARKRYEAKRIQKPRRGRKNPDGNAQAVARYRDQNQEQVRASARASYHRYATRNRERARAYHKVNPDKAQARVATRRARVRVDLSKMERASVEAFYRLSRDLTKRFGQQYHVDHIVPLSQGGMHHPDNLVVMRADYNQRKHARRWLALEKLFGIEAPNK